ncbi:MAG: nucleotidyltransferase family protein [Pyrinomonadaceae bacterium]
MEPGSLIAKTLRGAWRSRPPVLDVTADELERVAPLLIERGEGALGWWRVRRSALRTSPAALRLREAYRFQTVQAELYRMVIARLALSLREADLEALLGKGWAASRLYPEPGLRPSGDVDLYVPPDRYPHAVALLDGLNAEVSESGLFSVDMHCGAAELDDRGFEDLSRRSVEVYEAGVRVFSPEDHLRLLCLHALRHGMCRPLWLCDIAAALESRASDFDWDYFFEGDARRTGWVVCALRLAHLLLDARLDDTPLESGFPTLPDWLPRAVIKQWQTPTTPHGRRAPMIFHLRRRAGVAQALRQRWPNPIEATVTLHGPFDTRLRLPFQLGSSLVRLARLTGRFCRKD